MSVSKRMGRGRLSTVFVFALINVVITSIDMHMHAFLSRSHHLLSYLSNTLSSNLCQLRITQENGNLTNTSNGCTHMEMECHLLYKY